MGDWMIEHFRKLLKTVDPELLTLEDRIALLKLVQACLDADKKQRGGGGHRCSLPRSFDKPAI
jgi:hypothetical protein